MSEDKETIKITFDEVAGIITYVGPREDGEELLKILEDAGAGFKVYSRFTSKANDPTIPDTDAHVVILPTKEMKEKYPRSK